MSAFECRYAYMSVYIYGYMYLCRQTCMYVHTDILHICMHIHMSVCIHISIHRYKCIHINVCINLFLYVYVLTHSYPCLSA